MSCLLRRLTRWYIWCIYEPAKSSSGRLHLLNVILNDRGCSSMILITYLLITTKPTNHWLPTIEMMPTFVKKFEFELNFAIVTIDLWPRSIVSPCGGIHFAQTLSKYWWTINLERSFYIFRFVFCELFFICNSLFQVPTWLLWKVSFINIVYPKF